MSARRPYRPEAVSRRLLSAARARATDRAALVAFGALALILVIALVMRLVELGERAMHHDESLHALYAYRFAEGQGYRHDPLMHGPLQFHLIAAFFKALGAGEAVSRLPAALMGTALVATPLLLRHWLGRTGVVAAAVLLAASPSLLYYSRFARNETFAAVFTVLLAAAVWRYRQDGRTRWLVLLAAATALHFATKETAYLSAAIFLLYTNAALTGVILDRRGVLGRSRWEQAVAVFPVAWIAALAWPLVGSRLHLGARPREADLLVVQVTLVLPFLAAGIQVPVTALGGIVDGDLERTLGGLTVGALVVSSAALGLAWDWRRWLPLAAVLYVIVLPLFTTGFTNPDGFAGPFWTQLDYWLAQQDVRRGTQPWFYYLMMVPLYEFLALIPALVGGVWLLRRQDGLARLLAWWFLGTLLALSYAGEKMPWLTVHLAVPLALLAALALGRVLPDLMRRASVRGLPRLAWPPLAAAGAASVLLLALALRGGAAVSYAHPDTPIEPLIYTQTSPDVTRLIGEIDALAIARGGKDQLPVLVETAQSLTWPWAWYLRDYTQASYVSTETLTEDGIPEGAVVIATAQSVAANPELRERFASAVPYTHRWWFPEFADSYRSTTFESLFEGLADGSMVGRWVEFYSDRIPVDRIGTLDGHVLFPAAPAPASPPPSGAP